MQRRGEGQLIDNIFLILLSVIVPLIFYIVIQVLRYEMDVPTSAGTDVIVIIALFDVSLIVEPETYQTLVTFSDLIQHITKFGVVALILCFSLIIVSISRGEKKIAEAIKSGEKPPFMALVSILGSVVFLIATHVLFFRWEG